MRCPKCGKTVDASARMCPVCHTQLYSAGEQSSITNVNNNQSFNTVYDSVVRSSASVGTGKCKCPKCGKTLDASVKKCPVCHTQLVISGEQSGKTSQYDQRISSDNTAVNTGDNINTAVGQRCPKCGKMLADKVQMCPVCRTRLITTGNVSSTADSIKAQQQPEPAIVRPQPVYDNTVVMTRPAQQQSSKKRSKKPVAIAVAIASAAAVIAIAVIGLNLFKKDKGDDGVQMSDSQSYETVNSKLSEVLSDSAEDSEKLKQQVGSALDDLAKNGMVKDVRFVDQTGMYEFTYDDGTQGGVMLEPFKEGAKGIQKNYASKDNNGKVVSYNNRVNLDKSKYTYSQNPKAKIMYGLGMPKTLSDMKKRNEVWKSEGLAVDIDEECTVEDFAKDLKGYDYIEIDEHGSIYDDVPVICLKEYATKENREKYSKDLKEHNIILTKVRDADPNKSYYWIKPSFFKEHYGNKGLSGSIIYLGCCYGYMKKDLVEAIKGVGADTVLGYNYSVYADYDYYIQDAFVYSLMYGDNVSESLKYAKSIWGKNDADWYKLYSGRNKTDGEPAELKLYGDSQKTLVKIKSIETTTATTQKPEEKPVPDKIKEMLEYTEPDYGGQPGGPAAAFMTYYGYRGHEGTQQDVMWFQDMDGDNVPDLVVGGYSVVVDGIQGSAHCFEIQLSKGNGGGIVHLLLDNSTKSKHGHEAFMMQAYKDKNGALMFTHTQFYAYTSPDSQRDPNYAGAFTIYEYSFAGGKGDSDKKQILYYTYDPRQGTSENAFSCTDGNGKRITASAAKQMFNSYYSSKTPLRANVKTINYQKYMREMTQEQRKQALMDSYYAFSYTDNKRIAPYGKEVFDKMPSAAATTTTTTQKPQTSADAMYASYANAVETFRSKHDEHAYLKSYFVCDIDNDSKPELVLWDMAGFSANRHVAVYKYDTSSQKAKLYAEGEMGGSVSYSKKLKALVAFYAHGADTQTFPSGMMISVTKGIIRNGKITEESVVYGDYDQKKNLADQYSGDVEQGDISSSRVTANDIKANAAKNKAA